MYQYLSKITDLNINVLQKQWTRFIMSFQQYTKKKLFLKKKNA